MNKKNILKISATVLAIIAIVLLLRGDEDTWLCQNGQWVKHGNPRAPRPTELCGEKPASKEVAPSVVKEEKEEGDIIVFSPRPDEEISSPLVIEGKARGPWFFEASFPTRLLDGEENILASGIATASSDWMTTEYVSFKAVLDFVASKSGAGILVLAKDNPSGLPENAKEIRLPVKIKAAETAKIKVYFNNNKMDPEISCNKVFPTEREIHRTSNVARLAVEQLLQGPTEEEKVEGYFTSINSGVKIQGLTVEGGTATVDFDKQMEFQMGGSCRVSAIRAQITQTLKQFPDIQEVVISVNGRTEDILQP